MSTNREMNEENVGHIHSGIQLWRKVKWRRIIRKITGERESTGLREGYGAHVARKLEGLFEQGRGQKGAGEIMGKGK